MGTFYLFLVFLVSQFLHLTARIPALGIIRIEMVLAFCIALSIILNKSWISKNEGEFPAVNQLVVLLAYILVTIPLVEWPGSVLRESLGQYLKVVPYFFFLVALVDTEKKVKILMVVFLFCQFFRVLEPVYLNLTEGYWGSYASFGSGFDMGFLGRLSGAPSDIINPNQLAGVIVSTVPFLFFLGWYSGFKFKMLIVGIFSVLTYALVLTGSRGGMLSLGVVVLAIIYVSGKRITGVVIAGLLLVPLAFFIAGLMSSDLRERYASIFDENAAGRGSVEGRFIGIKKGLSSVIGPRIFFGHGLGTSVEVSANKMEGRAQRAHNLYIEILQELGVVGLIIFLLYVREMWRSLTWAKHLLLKAGPEAWWLRNLTLATMAWIVMDLFYSFGSFGLNSWEWYFFGGLSTVCLNLARKRDALGVEGVPPTIDFENTSKSFNVGKFPVYRNNG